MTMKNTSFIHVKRRKKYDRVTLLYHFSSATVRSLFIVTTLLFVIIIPSGISFPLHPPTARGFTALSIQNLNVPTAKRELDNRNRIFIKQLLLRKLQAKSKSVIEEGRIPNNSNDKPTSVTNKAFNQSEQLLIQQLNQLRNDVIQSSKQRRNKLITNGDIERHDNNHPHDNHDYDEYYSNQKHKIIQMMNLLQTYQSTNEPNQNQKHKQNFKTICIEASHIIDTTLRHCTNEAFQLYYNFNKKNNERYGHQHSTILWKQVQFGLEIMDLQFVSKQKKTHRNNDASNSHYTIRTKAKLLSSPYDSIPQSVCLQALKALNKLLQKSSNHKFVTNNLQIQQSNAAFRILQRLCTGKGVRTTTSITTMDRDTIKNINTNSTKGSKSPVNVQINLDERDFNMVLSGFVNTNQMNQAHRVIALQVRTKHAPPLSPITYSILIKGYGNLNDAESVNLCMRQCYDHGIIPDIIMYNSLIDAYVNCNEIELAYDIFKFLKRDNFSRHYFGSENHPYLLHGQDRQGYKSINDGDDETRSEDEEVVIPAPNVRTYNTMLKGFVKDGNIKQAMKLSEEMKQAELWDDITTNTLVSAAITTSDFDLAESILTNHTNYEASSKESSKGKRQQHPNVEAYTELLDGYAKANYLNKALYVLKLMRERGVNPNEYSYTCMIGALAKAQKIHQAKKLMDFMETSDGISPSIITYNAFLSGMFENDKIDDKRSVNDAGTDAIEDDQFNMRVNQASDIFNSLMQKPGVYPNDITVATMVDALSRCKPTRLDEAKELIIELDNKGLVSSSNQRVCTALIRACTNSLDLDGIESAYKKLQSPDIISFNTLLDGYCRCGKVKKGLEVMAENNEICRNGGGYITPDVITYTILISAVLRIGTSAASRRALLLYNEMKSVWGIFPDQALVDIILISMISGGNSLGINDEDVIFTKKVLNDAKQMQWKTGELYKRRMAVKGVFMGRFSEVWKEDEERYGMKSNAKKEQVQDPLFVKKNWNQIDSGFRLWGGTRSFQEVKPKMKKSDVDEFLASKNWNDMDSGFRIL